MTLETTIAASKKFETFVSPEVLDVSNIPPLLRSSAILAATRLAVVSSITAYLAGASRLQVRTLASALAENGWGLPYESIEALRTAGATTGQVVALIAARGDRLPVDQLKLLLRALGGDYSRVANGGRGRPTFNVDSAHTYVLNRLVGDTIKQVETETFKLKGPKLVAPLQQEKVDDILRAQKDSALARMIGVGLVIDDAMLKREHVGRVSEVTWSSLHGAAQTIAETQSYALHRLDSLAEKMEKESRVGDLAKIAKIAEADVEEWLAVLARCFQLQDGLAVLELDRVLDSSPDDLDRHREAIQAGRAKRRDLIAKSTERLLARMDSAAVTANRKVLFHPLKPGEVVRSSNEVGADVLVFHEMLGISDTRVNLKKKHWAVAVVEARDATVEAGVTTAQTAGKLGARGAEAVALFSADAAHSAKDTVVKVSSAVMSKLRRSAREKPSDADPS